MTATRKSMFLGPVRSFTISTDDGRVATVRAACAYHALTAARALWPDASSWSWAEVAQ